MLDVSQMSDATYDRVKTVLDHARDENESFFLYSQDQMDEIKSDFSTLYTEGLKNGSIIGGAVVLGVGLAALAISKWWKRLHE